MTGGRKRRMVVKEIINLLVEAQRTLRTGPGGIFYAEQIWSARRVIDAALAGLQTPRWYTPEQWEERTGEPWPDNGAVYMLYKPPEISGVFPFWRIETYCYAKMYLNGVAVHSKSCIAVVCATEAGPPPDGWRPE
jgi:hypothetical protein